MELQELITKAWNLKKEGKRIEALKLYSRAFDVLTQEAIKYARGFDDVIKDEGNTRKILPKYFEKSKEYLKQSDVACKISNNMGTIFAEIGNFEGAKKMFQQAIKLTPDDIDYQDPKIGLEELEK